MKNPPQEKTLDTLFESKPKIRLLKFFLRNQERFFDMKEICGATLLSRQAAANAIKSLSSIGLVSARRAKKGTHFAVNKNFSFFWELHAIITKSFPIPRDQIVKIVKRAGAPRLLLIGGAFLNADKRRVDVLVVANKPSEHRFAKAFKLLEAEVGQELLWSLFPTKEFLYRKKMFDRFLRDIFEYPHEILTNKL